MQKSSRRMSGRGVDERRGSGEGASRSTGTVESSARRTFLNWILGAGAGGVAAAVLYPVVRYLIPPRVEESVTSQVTLPFGPADLEPNSGRIFRFGSRPGLIIKTEAGELRAFDAICTHLDCIVQYRPDLKHIWCACHNGHYDRSGRNIKGPPPRPLQPFAVRVQDDRIVVSKEI